MDTKKHQLLHEGGGVGSGELEGKVVHFNFYWLPN